MITCRGGGDERTRGVGVKWGAPSSHPPQARSRRAWGCKDCYDGGVKGVCDVKSPQKSNMGGDCLVSLGARPGGAREAPFDRRKQRGAARNGGPQIPAHAPGLGSLTPSTPARHPGAPRASPRARHGDTPRCKGRPETPASGPGSSRARGPRRAARQTGTCRPPLPA